MKRRRIFSGGKDSESTYPHCPADNISCAPHLVPRLRDSGCTGAASRGSMKIYGYLVGGTMVAFMLVWTLTSYLGV